MQSQFSQEMLDRIQRTRVVSVLVVDQVQSAVPLARALLAGGIDIMELTLRTPVAIECLKEIRKEVPEMLAGVGTILTPEQVDQVVEAGALFGVAPGLNRRVIQRAQQSGLPFAPGVMTPSDMEAAIELGCRELKFFPAEPSGGLKTLNSMKAPYLHLGVKFIPLGGVNLANMTSYLANGDVLAVGGSWIAPPELVDGEKWDTISSNAAEACRIANS